VKMTILFSHRSWHRNAKNCICRWITVVEQYYSKQCTLQFFKKH